MPVIVDPDRAPDKTNPSGHRGDAVVVISCCGCGRLCCGLVVGIKQAEFCE
jgi:hypothetical protein